MFSYPWIFQGNMEEIMLFKGTRTLGTRSGSESHIVCVKHKSDLMSIIATTNVIKSVKQWDSKAKSLGQQHLEVESVLVSMPIYCDGEYIRTSLKEQISSFRVDQSDLYKITEDQISEVFLKIYQRYMEIKSLYERTMEIANVDLERRREQLSEIKRIVSFELPPARVVAKEIVLDQLKEVVELGKFLQDQYLQISKNAKQSA